MTGMRSERVTLIANRGRLRVRLVEVESPRSFYYGTRIAVSTAVPTLAPPAIWMSPHPEGEQPPRDRSVTTVCELRLFVGAGQGQLGAVFTS